MSEVGDTDISVNYRVTTDTNGVKYIHATISKGGSQGGFILTSQGADRIQISLEPASATTTAERVAMLSTVMADIDNLFKPEEQ